MELNITVYDPWGLCSFGSSHDGESHECPYQVEISNNDDPEYCTCCDQCTNQCAWEV